MGKVTDAHVCHTLKMAWGFLVCACEVTLVMCNSATLWTVALQASLSVGFRRREYWSGLPFPSPGDFPNPGTEPASFMSPALANGFFTTSATNEQACDLQRGEVSASWGLPWRGPRPGCLLQGREERQQPRLGTRAQSLGPLPTVTFPSPRERSVPYIHPSGPGVRHSALALQLCTEAASVSSSGK